ncbi:MAG: glycosyltransferase [Pseudomonadota bacterium]
MKILLITNLFPNSKQPGLAAYNLQQLKSLNRHKNISVEVIAPVPWVPSYKWLPEPLLKALDSRILLEHEIIDGINVYHCQYLVIPKILRFLHGIFFYFGIKKLVKQRQAEKSFDVVLSAWGWPDVFGSVLICKQLGLPIVANLLGSDIHLYSKISTLRIQMKWAFKQCQHLVCVSKTLSSRLIEIGLPEKNMTVLLNGVDHKVFYPREFIESAKKLNLQSGKQRILFVGNFYPVKGVDILIKAFSLVSKEIDNLELMLVGDGQKAEAIKNQIQSLGLEKQVKFVGRQPHDKTPLWFNACDVFCLPSRSEGCPNVVLEAVACGCIIVASDVGSVYDILENNKNAIVVPNGDIEAMAIALIESLRKEKIVKLDELSLWPSWDDNADKLKNILSISSNLSK